MLDIYIDADACPVKEETIRVAERYGLHVFMVSNQSGRPLHKSHVERVQVGDGFDAADDWIAQHIQPKDIAVTNDIKLAARCLKAEAVALSATGRAFTADNIGGALAMRELNSYLREADEIKEYNAPFSARDRSQFLQSLDAAIQKIKRGSG